ncbi:MAG: hypothetical protein MUC96_35560 [Myxococcaceae bacterium]|jgi:hypothetical protein|nr:hypothetical protein [Myxococcaceae bacterium]
MADDKKPQQQQKSNAVTPKTAEQLDSARKGGHRVSGTFELVERHYRLGRLYEVGELITVENEMPSRAFAVWNPNKPPEAPPVSPLTVPSSLDL